MRYAVKDRPVEQFDVTLELPEWQLEPDEEALFGAPEDYYYIDEQGNVIEPGRREPEQTPFGQEGERGPNAPPAASEDFLEEATGGALPQQAPRPPREPRRAAPQQQAPPKSPEA
jgi:penicillin-binding protein 1A